MAGVTNKGKAHFLNVDLRNATEPTNFYVALVTSATAPGPDTNTMSDLTEIAAGNGYTAGGYQLDRNSTDFDVFTEDDVNDRALMQIKDVVWTASGGPIPASGSDARYAVLTDDNATLADREVLVYWDLGGDYGVSAGQTLTLQDLEVRASES